MQKMWMLLAAFAVNCAAGKAKTGTGAHTTMQIGAAGGAIALEAATLVVPAGALTTTTTLTLTSTTSAAPSGYVAWSPVYKFEPEGLVFAVPASVTFAPAAGAPANAAVFWSAPAGGGFEALATTPDGALMKASVTHFSGGFLGTATEGSSTCSAPAASCSPACSTTCSGGEVAVCAQAQTDKLGNCSGANSCTCSSAGSWQSCSAPAVSCSPACSVSCSGDTPFAQCTSAAVDKAGGCSGANLCTCQASAPYLTCSAPSTCGAACSITCAVPTPYATCSDGTDKSGCATAPACSCSATTP